MDFINSGPNNKGTKNLAPKYKNITRKTLHKIRTLIELLYTSDNDFLDVFDKRDITGKTAAVKTTGITNIGSISLMATLYHPVTTLVTILESIIMSILKFIV